jgi:hypothetical protein
MGMISGLFLLPLAPLRGVTWIAEQIAQDAERQWYDPGVIQAELEQVDELREAGILDADEAERREELLIERLLRSPAQPDPRG